MDRAAVRPIMVLALLVLPLLWVGAPDSSASAQPATLTAVGDVSYDGDESGELVVIMATIMDCGCVGDISPFVGPVEEWFNISEDFRHIEFGQRGTQDIFFHRHSADVNFGNGDGEVDVGEALLIWDGLVNVGEFRGWGQGQHVIQNPSLPQSISYEVPAPERVTYFWAYMDSNGDDQFSAGDPWGEACGPVIDDDTIDFGTIYLLDRGIVATNCLPRPGMYGMVDGKFGTSFTVPRPVPPLEAFIGPVDDPSLVQFLWEGEAWFNHTRSSDQHTFYLDHEIAQHDGTRTVSAPGWFFGEVEFETMGTEQALNENRTEWTWEMIEGRAFTDLELTFVRSLDQPQQEEEIFFQSPAGMILLSGGLLVLIVVGIGLTLWGLRIGHDD